MAFSGGTFSRTFDCTTDRDNGIKILASKFDTELDGMAVGLSTAILKDGTQTCTAAIPFAQGITLPDDKTIAFGTNSDVLIQYDETTTDSLKISAAEGAGLAITLMADEGDDAGDEWKLNIADGGTLTLGNDINSAGTYVTHLTITPNATVANSTMAVAGNLTVGGALTLGSGAVISEAELETIDGITPGTVLASKAMVVDANKDITGGRNLTITGELDADNININGNTIISTDTNGDINISPDGTGTVVIDTDLDVDNINVNGNTVSSTDTNGDINLSPNGTGTVVINTDLDVDNININGNTIISTDTNGNIALTPNGTGEVDISKVDIASGEIDGTTIGANSAAAGTFTTLSATTLGSSVDLNSQALTNANIDSGAIDGVTLGTNSAVTEAQVDNININGNTISSTDTNGNITLAPNGTGVVALSSTDLTFGDNDKAIFGAGSDLQIFHDGSDSIINDAGTGSLKFQYGGTDGVVFDSSGNVGIGAPPNATFGSLLYTQGTPAANKPIVSAYSQGNSNNAGFALFNDNGNRGIWTTGSTMRFTRTYEGNSTADLTIDASGNVGIGGVPGSKLNVISATSGGISIAQGTENFYGASAHRFFTDGYASEVLRIDSSGNLLVGTTSSLGNYLTVGSSSVAGSSGHFDRSGDGGLVRFYRTGSEVGSISVASSSTAYNTSSDYRLKTAVEYDWDATTRLKQLKPARFEWISDRDDADTTVDGFLAHEVEDIVPEAITGTKDAMRDEEYEVSAATGDIYTPAIEAVLDEDGNEVTPAVAEVIHSTDAERPEELAEGQQWRETKEAVMGTRSVPDYQGIDQSKVVPLLTKALIESVAKIEALEARIAALEAG
jgi:cytoskeletal protein CcmA (bactofilin family)